MVSKRSERGGYKESPSLGEDVLIPLLVFALDGKSDNIQSDFASDSSSDIQSDLPEAKLNFPDADVRLLVLLWKPLLSLVSPNAVLVPLKLNRL
jgi:hypothetical protein